MTDKLYYSKREFLFDEDSENREARIDACVSLDEDVGHLEANLTFLFGNTNEGGAYCYLWGRGGTASGTGKLHADEFVKFLDELADTALALRHAFVEARRKLLENYRDKGGE